MIFIIVGLVIAAALIVALLARGHESSSPLKTVESFKLGLEKISPEEQARGKKTRQDDRPGLLESDRQDVSEHPSVRDEGG